MASKNKYFQMFPWVGGVNSSLDPSVIPPNQLTEAKNALFGVRGSRKKRPGITHNWDNGITGSQFVIGLVDFWYGSGTKTKRLFSVFKDKTFHSYTTSGTKTTIPLDGSATAWPGTITNAAFEIMNNKLIIAVDGTSNIPKKWEGVGNNVFDLGGSPPFFSICRQHLGRLWANDLTNPDRIHYTTTGNPEEWQGNGDSGALDIGIGDGDPSGITAIFPTFKGDLFVAKKTKLYRITGNTPESFEVRLVSSGIGCISHNSITPVDQDDIVFCSERGFHSLIATANFGDFEGAFLSKDIQQTFNDNFVKSRLPNVWGVYLSSINSVAFAVTDSVISSNYNNTIWLYNFEQKAWYNWPNIPCSSMCISSDDDQKRFYLGGITSRVSKTFNDLNYDISTSGVNTAIAFKIKTGIIYVDEQPYLIKGFKKLALIFNPVGIFTLTVTVKIDNYSTQSLAFTSDTSFLELLGINFILGTSVLGSNLAMAPYTIGIDGYGRGIQITIEQNDIDQEAEVQGIGIEYRPAGMQQETILGE